MNPREPDEGNRQTATGNRGERSHGLSPRSRSAGFSLVEALVAAAIVLTALALGVELLTGGMRAWARASERATAARLAANVAETWLARDWNEWRDGDHAVPARDLQELPRAQGAARIEPDPGFPGLKRLTVRLTWHPATGPQRAMTLETLRGK